MIDQIKEDIETIERYKQYIKNIWDTNEDLKHHHRVKIQKLRVKVKQNIEILLNEL